MLPVVTGVLCLFYTTCMPWPCTIPHDLARKLAALDAYQSPAFDADRWAVIKEWLEEHEVPAPDRLPTAPEVKRGDEMLNEAAGIFEPHSRSVPIS